MCPILRAAGSVVAWVVVPVRLVVAEAGTDVGAEAGAEAVATCFDVAEDGDDAGRDAAVRGAAPLAAHEHNNAAATIRDALARPLVNMVNTPLIVE
ncbi:MAG: hypothetical protein WC869_04290 [Phycisphaerae bacterium]|jgi:hypothetical protein